MWPAWSNPTLDLGLGLLHLRIAQLRRQTETAVLACDRPFEVRWSAQS